MVRFGNNFNPYIMKWFLTVCSLFVLNTINAQDFSTRVSTMDTGVSLSSSVNPTTRAVTITPNRGLPTTFNVPMEALINDSVSRNFNETFQLSASRACRVNYSIKISCTITLTGAQSGSVFLETSSDGVNWKNPLQVGNDWTATLVIGVSMLHASTYTVSKVVPAGHYVRLRTLGNATFTYLKGQETYL